MTRPGPVGVIVVVLVLVVSGAGSGPILLVSADSGFESGSGSGSGTGFSPELDSRTDTEFGTATGVGPSTTVGTEAEPHRSIPPATAVGAPDPATFSSADVTSEDFDSTTFEITVHENGSATWTFRYEQPLGEGDNATTEESFEAFAETFESEETELYTFFTRQTQAMVDSGTELTGREMTATNFERSARIEGPLNPVGVVEMSFRWDGFAATEDGAVVVGDVFQNLYLTADQSLVVAAGDGLAFRHVEPEGDYTYRYDSRTADTSLEDAESVRWRGEREFFDGRPYVVFDRTATSGGTLASMTEAGPSWSVITVGLAILLAAGGGAVWYRRRRDGWASGDGSVPERTGVDGGEATNAAEPDRAVSSPSVAATGGSSGESAGSEPNTSSESAPLSDEELLTDEDRVVKLIRENGGRMKQVKIVEETGWSKSKVSMLLSDMEDDGTISKLRVGRENIISLEGFEPEATKSPFDE